MLFAGKKDWGKRKNDVYIIDLHAMVMLHQCQIFSKYRAHISVRAHLQGLYPPAVGMAARPAGVLCGVLGYEIVTSQVGSCWRMSTGPI